MQNTIFRMRRMYQALLIQRNAATQMFDIFSILFSIEHTILLETMRLKNINIRPGIMHIILNWQQIIKPLTGPFSLH